MGILILNFGCGVDLFGRIKSSLTTCVHTTHTYTAHATHTHTHTAHTKRENDNKVVIHTQFVLTAGGAQGPTTIKVYELLHNSGPNDVEETRKAETTQLQIILGVILLRYTCGKHGQSHRGKRVTFLLFGSSFSDIALASPLPWLNK